MTFWLTTVGIVILVGFAIAFYFADRNLTKAKQEADYQTEQAEQAREEVKQAEEKVKQAQEEVNQAEEEVNQAEEKVNQAEEKVKEAREKAKQAQEEAEEQKGYAKDARFKVNAAERKVDNLNLITDSIQGKLDTIKIKLKVAIAETDTLNTVSQAKVDANRALEFMRLGISDSAKFYTDRAYDSLRTKSIPTNRQTLYEVYTELTPESSILGKESHQKTLQFKTLITL